MREYVPIFFDWLENTKDLTDEERGRLINAVILYASSQEYEHLLVGIAEKIAFRFMKGQIDRNAAISEVRAKAGASRREQPETNENKLKQTEAKQAKEEKEKKEKEKEDKFNQFWDAYPRHVNKPSARKAFDRLNVDDELLATILSAIERQKGSAQWQEKGGQFIPHPATWLNGKRWEDEIQAPQNGYKQRDYVGEQDEAMQRMIKAMQEGA